LQKEEAILFELYDSYGYDPRELECYQCEVDKLEAQQSFAERQSREQVDQTFLEEEIAEKLKQKQREEEQLTADTKLLALPADNFEYFEEIADKENARLEELKEIAETHSIVQDYNDEEEYEAVDPLLYPPSFERVVPKSVLKALYHTG
jgi:hypothetical protein